MAAKQKTTHGGRRKGAGRPEGKAARLRVYSVRLTDRHAVLLRLWGAGNVSEGVRELVEKEASRFAETT